MEFIIYLLFVLLFILLNIAMILNIYSEIKLIRNQKKHAKWLDEIIEQLDKEESQDFQNQKMQEIDFTQKRFHNNRNNNYNNYKKQRRRTK